MRKLYAEQKHTIYELEKHLGVSKVYLYHYVYGERDISKMGIDIFIRLADYEGVGIRELYRKIKEYQKGNEKNEK